MKYILHIDTSGDTCNVFIAENGKLIQQKISREAKTHAAAINTLINEVLVATNIKMEELIAVSVIGGPGSYTGLRIGLATAKGMCYVQNIPLIVQNKLDLIAGQTLYTKPEIPLVLAILPAREKEYFACIKSSDNMVLEPQHINEEALICELEQLEHITVVATGLNNGMAQFINSQKYQLVESENLDIEYWSIKSLQLFEGKNFANIATIEPFYLKSVYVNKAL